MFDAIVVGGGPCGVSTAIYLKRANVNVVVIEKSYVGGQVGRSSELDNYAGFVEKDTFTFCENMKHQLENLGVQIIRDCAVDVDLSDEKVKKIIGKKGTYEASTIILCIGADEKKLDLPNIDKYIGSGVSYCAVCDGNFFKNKVVCVVGGGSSAFEDAVYLSKLASKVHLIHRRETFTAERYLVQKVEALSCGEDAKMEVHTNTTVTALFGENTLNAVELTNEITREKTTLATDGLFLCIGRKPKLEFLIGKVETTKTGYIVVDKHMQTSVKGVFAGGDCIDKEVRQVVTAVADGAVISKGVLKYLDSINLK